jgi:hypothetical protein
MANKQYPQQFKADAVALYRSRPGAVSTTQLTAMATAASRAGQRPVERQRSLDGQMTQAWRGCVLLTSRLT